MASSRSRLLSIIVTVFVIALVAAGSWVAKDRFMNDTAGAADTASVSDSTMADSDGKGEKGKGKKGKDEDGDDADSLVPVELAEALTRDMSAFYTTTASLEPEKKVDLLAKIGGEVKRIYAEEGDFVQAGAIICQLEDDEQRVALAKAEIAREQQKREYDRFKEMYDQNLVSEKEFGDAEFAYQTAVNDYEAAALRLAYTKVRAPFSGIVTERLVDQGENVATGGVVFRCADITPLLLTMYVPENAIGNLAAGQRVIINPDSDPELEFDGEILRLAPEVDQRTGTIKVTAKTESGGLPGSFVRVRVITDTRKGTLSVPRRSVLADAGERFVYVAEADTVRKVTVEVGYEDIDFAEIVEGLDTGQHVVSAGMGGVRTGTKVKVITPDVATNTP